MTDTVPGFRRKNRILIKVKWTMDKDACLDSTAELGCFDNGQGLRFRVWGKGYWIFYA